MTEYETDPQRRPAETGTEPAYPTAEPARPDAAGTAEHPLTVSEPPSGSTGYEPPSGSTAYEPTSSEGVPAPTPRQAADEPTPVAGFVGHPTPGSSTFGPATPGPSAGPSTPGQATGPWQPGWAPATGPYGPPGAGGQPTYPGAPVPPWAQGPAPAPRPGRAVKYVIAGVVALGLMLGSAVGGGALVMALDRHNDKTYSAAPIINSADLPAIAAKVANSVVSITTGEGEGSGVVLSSDGYILTNNHVVATANGDTVRVVFADGRNVSAKIIGTDPKTDLAVVRVEGVSNLTKATLGDSDAMQVGDTVLALGSPLGLQGSVTAGIISAKDRTIRAGEGGQQRPGTGAASISGLLQTDAPINPGNSGGALVNTRGEVIGINTAIATAGQGSNGNIGVGFAIPSNKAGAVAKQLQRGEKVSHPSLGVAVSPAENGGALVSTVVPGSAADKAGLKQGDVITRFGDKVIGDSDDLVAAVQGARVGEQVELTYSRDGSVAKATVTLAEAS